MSARSRPGSIAESESIGPYGRTKLKSATPGPGMGRASRPGSLRPTSEFGKDNYDEDDEEGNEEEVASDYGDNEEGEGEATAPGEEKKLLSAEEERILEEMSKREVDLQSYVVVVVDCSTGASIRQLSTSRYSLTQAEKAHGPGSATPARRTQVDQFHLPVHSKSRSTRFAISSRCTMVAHVSYCQVYRDRYPGAGHIAKNVAALIGVVAKTHVGEVIELGEHHQQIPAPRMNLQG